MYLLQNLDTQFNRKGSALLREADITFIRKGNVLPIIIRAALFIYWEAKCLCYLNQSLHSLGMEVALLYWLDTTFLRKGSVLAFWWKNKNENLPVSPQSRFSQAHPLSAAVVIFNKLIKYLP